MGNSNIPGGMLFLLSLLGLLRLVQAAPALSADVCAAGNSTKAPVKFAITLTESDVYHDGFKRQGGILMNGQFPGPLLELYQGDEVEFTVWNLLPYSTTVHFHGIDQLGTPWSDGVPGLSQRGIKPGQSFVYKWKANQYGSYFYHAHEKGQIEDGLYGPIHIKPADSVERPFSLISNDSDELEVMRKAEDNTKPIILSDWRHLPSQKVWDAEEATGLDAYCANSLLINGKGSVNCLPRETINEFTSAAVKQVLNGSQLTDMGCIPPTVSVIQGPFPHNFSAIPSGLYSGCESTEGSTEVLTVDPHDGYASWDLIGAANQLHMAFSIDEHPMYVYAVDGRYIEPQLVDVVTVTNGRRLSILVKLDKPAGDYTVRSVADGLNQMMNASATLTYINTVKTQSGPSKPYINLVASNATADVTFQNESTIVPFPVETPAESVDQTFILNLNHYNASYRWTLGNSSYPLSLEESQPLLFYPDSPAAYNDLTIRTKNGTWVDLIFNVTGPLQGPHPIHKHSTKFFMLGSGDGAWTYASVAEAAQHIPQSLNFKNPPLLDTTATPAAASGPSWLAIRYQVVNPGAFLVHCHIQVHLSGGMALAILDGVDAWPTIPEEYQLASTC
ncbi:laccase-1 [Paecilomyces variotii No. 5]|uniref:Laccase-1 n=1 Tax=Byssochlamys spectabilis (strain No. 5 / NBRC 109023) TaxID=1356009 RepID=V5G506_BYSSN|nr:laccase-1 [Paecilomyces variotii No. 5]